MMTCSCDSVTLCAHTALHTHVSTCSCCCAHSHTCNSHITAQTHSYPLTLWYIHSLLCGSKSVHTRLTLTCSHNFTFKMGSLNLTLFCTLKTQACSQQQKPLLACPLVFWHTHLTPHPPEASPAPKLPTLTLCGTPSSTLVTLPRPHQRKYAHHWPAPSLHAFVLACSRNLTPSEPRWLW